MYVHKHNTNPARCWSAASWPRNRTDKAAYALTFSNPASWTRTRTSRLKYTRRSSSHPQTKASFSENRAKHLWLSWLIQNSTSKVVGQPVWLQWYHTTFSSCSTGELAAAPPPNRHLISSPWNSFGSGLGLSHLGTQTRGAFWLPKIHDTGFRIHCASWTNVLTSQHPSWFGRNPAELPMNWKEVPYRHLCEAWSQSPRQSVQHTAGKSRIPAEGLNVGIDLVKH